MKSDEQHEINRDDFLNNSEVVRDVSGNDESVSEVSENEEVNIESCTCVSIDYTEHFKNLENNVAFNNACLLGFILLFAFLKGLKKL